MTSNRHLIACLLSTALLTACGGGAGGGASPEAPSAPPALATPMTALVVPPTMSWATSSPATLVFVVRDAAGHTVPEAAVTVFTIERTNPHDGTPLDRPVAMERIDSSSTEADGRASMSAVLPGHLVEVMAVASHGDASARKVVSLPAQSGAIELSLSP